MFKFVLKIYFYSCLKFCWICQLDVFDAADRYAKTKTPLIAIVGKEYGCGSSRDWAAKGPFLLVSTETPLLMII